MTDHNQQSSRKYVQVNNPEPVFTVPQDYTPWPFSLKLMVKANGFTESFSFDVTAHEIEMAKMREHMRLMIEKLKATQPSHIASQAEETPPPHY